MHVTPCALCSEGLSSEITSEALVRKEVELLARTRHANIVRLRGYAMEAGHPYLYLVYEYMSGGDLGKALAADGDAELELGEFDRVKVRCACLFSASVFFSSLLFKEPTSLSCLEHHSQPSPSRCLSTFVRVSDFATKDAEETFLAKSSFTEI